MPHFAFCIEDPIANRLRATSPTNLTENKDAMMENDNVQTELKVLVLLPLIMPTILYDFAKEHTALPLL